jgi:negative regulator of sigma-B (phosphoserine phosphatase)
MAPMICSSGHGERLEWAVASMALAGETRSGDLHFVTEGDWGGLAAVVDGVGHGEEAMAAAQAAVAELQRHAREPVTSLIQRCHRALKSTRGAVITLVSFTPDDSTATAVGIGNVEAVLLHARPSAEPKSESVLLRGGVVGSHLPPLQTNIFSVDYGDVLIFSTDGVRNDFTSGLSLGIPIRTMAERVLKDYARGNDDALVLAVRYLGRQNRG